MYDRTIHFHTINTSMVVSTYKQIKDKCLCIYAYLYHRDILTQV